MHYINQIGLSTRTFISPSLQCDKVSTVTSFLFSFLHHPRSWTNEQKKKVDSKAPPPICINEVTRRIRKIGLSENGCGKDTMVLTMSTRVDCPSIHLTLPSLHSCNHVPCHPTPVVYTPCEMKRKKNELCFPYFGGWGSMGTRILFVVCEKLILSKQLC